MAAALVFLHHDRSRPLDAVPATLEALASVIRVRFPEVPQLSPDDLAAWLADDTRVRPQLLDVREPDEYGVSHLPGAIRIDPDAPAAAVLMRIDPTRPIVAYCSVGYRSSLLVQRLRAAGFTQAANLEGSIFAWANEGRPLESEGRRVTIVHPYDTTYARLLDRAHRAW